MSEGYQMTVCHQWPSSY